MTMKPVGYAEVLPDEELLARAREEGESDGQELIWDFQAALRAAHPLNNKLSTAVLLWDNFQSAYRDLEKAKREEGEFDEVVENALRLGHNPKEPGIALGKARGRVKAVEQYIESLEKQLRLLEIVHGRMQVSHRYEE
jgi:hypothetical protein